MSRWALLAVTLLGAVLRFGVPVLVDPPELIGDERYYVDTAIHLARGDGHRSSFYGAIAGWPPAHAWLLSKVIRDASPTTEVLSPRDHRRALLLESSMSTLAVALIALLGEALFGARVGLVAGLLAAIDPTFVAFGHYLWSENLFVLLITGGLLSAAYAADTVRWRWVLLSGAIFGVATLTREVGLLVALAVAAWWTWTGLPVSPAERVDRSGRRRAIALAAALLASAIVVVAPWSARNLQRLDRLVPVSTSGWMGLREGNTLGSRWLRPDPEALREFRSRYFAIDDELERTELARREALELIRDQQPWWIGQKLARNSALFFAPDSFLFKKISRGAYGQVPKGTVRALLIATTVFEVVVLSGAIFGIALAWRRRKGLLPLLVTAVVFGVHLVANASTRYRLPLAPLALVFAAFAASRLSEIGSLPGRSRVACTVAVLLLVVWPLVYFWPDAVSLWLRGSYVDPTRP